MTGESFESLQEFQFTHPGKGATSSAGAEGFPPRVSIHAPWEGCDFIISEGVQFIGSFNSRTLGRVRRL